MEHRLNQILTSINGMYHSVDSIVPQYVTLINEAVGIIRQIEAPDASTLGKAKETAITELGNELHSRFAKTFYQAPPERRKNEFMVSKMLVSTIIGNVVEQLSSPEK